MATRTVFDFVVLHRTEEIEEIIAEGRILAKDANTARLLVVANELTIEQQDLIEELEILVRPF